MTPEAFEQIKARIARLEEKVFGMDYETAQHVLDCYLEATKKARAEHLRDLEPNRYIHIAEDILGV